MVSGAKRSKLFRSVVGLWVMPDEAINPRGIVVPLGVRSKKAAMRAQSSGCKTKYKMSPSSARSEGGEAAAGYCLNSVSYRVDEAVKYNALNSD